MSASEPAALQYRYASGAAIAPYLDALARLRITVFREFPYLYDGDAEYEREYLQTYLASPRSLAVLVFDGDDLIGASTGLPLADETIEFQRAFREQGADIARIFYCGESVLLPAYRGRGVYRRLFEAREAHARALGGFTVCTFCCVQRAPEHARRPIGYTPLDAVWQRFGYREQPALETDYVWKDIDTAEATPKRMRFWIKSLQEQQA